MLWRLLGVVGLVMVTMLVVSFSASEPVVVYEAPTASSTLAVVPTKEPVTADLPTKPAAVVTAPPEDKKPTTATEVTTTIEATVPTVKKTPAPVAQKPLEQPTQSEFDLTAATLRGALVNILCLSGRQDIHSISGSGVIIDPRGIIVTNAHIAQHFLYMGYKSLEVSCTIRAGSPARQKYQARLMYLPEAWALANKDILTTTNPKGSGEHDFAFLAITGSASIPLEPLPETFPYIPFSTKDPSNGLPAVVGAYAGEFVSTAQIQSSFYPTIVFGSIKEIATFVASTIDIIIIDGSAASQSGSSGGGVARTPGELFGVITTSTRESDTSKRSLGGITASYIRRSYLADTGTPFEEFIGKSPIETASEFAPKISNLRAILTTSISH